MIRTPVNSSLISSIGIEERPEGHVMEIEFAKGGVYQYTGPRVREHYDALMKAPSAGQHFLRHVKSCPHTTFTKV
jgi:KTSC domain